MNDRALRSIKIGVGGKTNGVERDDSFTITAASEVMAILCLSRDEEDLKRRLGQIAVAYDINGNMVKAEDLNAQGAMAVLLKDAIKPNLVQSIEHVPALVHGGPFANISHGCNSVIATRIAMKLSDITITEAGFGADLGAFKFLDIKCRKEGIWPDACVIVSTVRSLKYNAGVPREELTVPNAAKVTEGFPNLAKHIENMKALGLPVIVASNKFPTDSPEEISELKRLCEQCGASYAPADIFSKGGDGGLELADKVLSVLDKNEKTEPCFVYDLEDSVADKIYKVATKVYGALSVDMLPEVAEAIKQIEAAGYGRLPICMAKTQYSLSDDQSKLGRPEGFTLTVREVRLAAGAGYIVVLTGKIMTMPGLPKKPAALDIDIDSDGTVYGLF